MRQTILVPFPFALAILQTPPAAGWPPQTSGVTALSVVGGTAAEVSGANGTFLRTSGGRAAWRSRAMPAAAELDFRDYSVGDRRTWTRTNPITGLDAVRIAGGAAWGVGEDGQMARLRW